MNENHHLDIDTYEAVIKSYDSDRSRGFICYAKEKLSAKHILTSRDFNAKANIELFVLKIGEYYVITGYKSPQSTNAMFEGVVSDIMTKLSRECKKIFIGDHNYDVLNARDSSNNYLVNYLSQYDLQPKLADAVTTDKNTQIDVIFTNFDNIECNTYETYFSYHKPIYAIVDPESSKKPDIETHDKQNKPDIETHDKQEKPDTETHDKQEKKRSNTNINQNEYNNNNDHEDDVRFPNSIPEDEYEFAISIENCNKIIRPNWYVNDSQVNFFQEIMDRRLMENGLDNFAQDVGFVRAFVCNLREIPQCNRNIQIVYSGGIGPGVIGHWICTKSDGNGKIQIYDSMNFKCLKTDQLDVLNCIYRFPKQYEFCRVQQQRNGVDCGVFAIYFATLLCYNINPSDQRNYDVRRMRRHIAKMLRRRTLENFPQDGYIN